MFNYEFYFFPLKYETWLVLNIQCSFNLKANYLFQCNKISMCFSLKFELLFVEILCGTL